VFENTVRTKNAFTFVSGPSVVNHEVDHWRNETMAASIGFDSLCHCLGFLYRDNKELFRRLPLVCKLWARAARHPSSCNFIVCADASEDDSERLRAHHDALIEYRNVRRLELRDIRVWEPSSLDGRWHSSLSVAKLSFRPRCVFGAGCVPWASYHLLTQLRVSGWPVCEVPPRVAGLDCLRELTLHLSSGFGPSIVLPRRVVAVHIASRDVTDDSVLTVHCTGIQLVRLAIVHRRRPVCITVSDGGGPELLTKLRDLSVYCLRATTETQWPPLFPPRLRAMRWHDGGAPFSALPTGLRSFGVFNLSSPLSVLHGCSHLTCLAVSTQTASLVGLGPLLPQLRELTLLGRGHPDDVDGAFLKWMPTLAMLTWPEPLTDVVLANMAACPRLFSLRAGGFFPVHAGLLPRSLRSLDFRVRSWSAWSSSEAKAAAGQWPRLRNLCLKLSVRAASTKTGAGFARLIAGIPSLERVEFANGRMAHEVLSKLASRAVALGFQEEAQMFVRPPAAPGGGGC